VAVLNKAAIFAAQSKKRRTLTVEEWGGDIVIRPLTAGEVQGLADVLGGGESRDLSENIEAALRIIAAGAVDDNGEHLFAGPDDLRDLEVGPLVAIASAIAEASGIAGNDKTGK